MAKFFRNVLQKLRRQNISDVIHEINVGAQLRRSVNLIQLIAIGIGSTIGAGIFTLSGQAATNHAGPSIIISFIIISIIAMLSAFSFSELGSMMAASGAAFTYTHVALGQYAAWFIGWNYALLYLFAALTVLTTWTAYFVHFVELISNGNITDRMFEAPLVWNETASHFQPTGQIMNLPAIFITVLITCILLIGIRQTATFNLILVAIKITILLVFIFASCKYVNRDNYTPFFPPNRGSFSEYGVSGMIYACKVIFFAHIGFDTIATVAEEAKEPQINIPIATIASVIISTLIYIGVSTIMVGLVPYQLLRSGNPLVDALNATPYGAWLTILLDIGALTSLTSVALTVILAQTRIIYAMARDRLLPNIFFNTNKHTNTPFAATIFCGLFCTVLSGLLPVDIVGETAGISALITYIFVHIIVIVMRFTHSGWKRDFTVPFGSWLIPILGCGFCIILLVNISKATFYRFLVWTGVGQIIYFVYGFRHGRAIGGMPDENNLEME